MEAQACLERLLSIVPTTKASAGNEPGELKLMIYVDEAHAISRKNLSGSVPQTLYNIMVKAFAEYHTSSCFIIFLSTGSKAHDLAAPTFLSMSARVRQSGQEDLLAPYNEMPFDCHKDLLTPIKPNSLTLADIQKISFLVRFGRPLSVL